MIYLCESFGRPWWRKAIRGRELERTLFSWGFRKLCACYWIIVIFATIEKVLFVFQLVTRHVLQISCSTSKCVGSHYIKFRNLSALNSCVHIPYYENWDAVGYLTGSRNFVSLRVVFRYVTRRCLLCCNFFHLPKSLALWSCHLLVYGVQSKT